MLNCTWTNPLDNVLSGSISVLAPTPILSLEGRKELAGSLWTSLAQGWHFTCTISWWMPIRLEKAIACPIFAHPSPRPALAGAFVTCSAPRGQREDGVSGYLGGQAATVTARGHGRVQGSKSSRESHGSRGSPVSWRGGTGELRGPVCTGRALGRVFSAAAEPEAEDRYRSSVRGASLCRGSLRTPRPEEEGAAGG